MICYPRKSTFSANTRQGYLYLSVDFNLTRRTFLPTILYSDSGCTYQCILVYNNGIRDAYRVPLPRCKFVQIIFSCPLKWGATHRNKLKIHNFPMSEAAFLIWFLDQRERLGGERLPCLRRAGNQYGRSMHLRMDNGNKERFPHWDVYISPRLTEAEYTEGKVNELLQDKQNVIYAEGIHLFH